MDIASYLVAQAEMHPSIEPQDVIKLCYQAAFGAEHLLQDIEAANYYFDSEFADLPQTTVPLYEQISSDIYRINLSAWKKLDIPQDWLFNMFILSSANNLKNDGETEFNKNMEQAEKLVQSQVFKFSYTDWHIFKMGYEKNGINSVHHSESYRKNEQPAYRIISSRFVRLIPLLKKISDFPESTNVRIIAIDGRSASGKTTIASQLEAIIGAGIVHMDDFFLPPDLRTRERFAQSGGNIHHERFSKEVIPHLVDKKAFTYKIFDCGTMDFSGLRQVDGTLWRIVEGAYSCHPRLGEYMEIRVFSDITPQEQLDRISIRNGNEVAEIFASKWIPLEEEYLQAYKIKERAHINI